MKNLTDKYRPTTLAEVVGQSAAVAALESFAAAPFSGAFVFDGSTGVGKTAAAKKAWATRYNRAKECA